MIDNPVLFEGLKLFSVKEIAATKAYSIGRRGTMKDYVDLYFIYKDKYSDIDETIALAKRKYGGEFNARLFAEQLIYLDDIDDEEIRFLRHPISRGQLSDFFKDVISELEI